jgi:hypothetical protein
VSLNFGLVGPPRLGGANGCAVWEPDGIVDNAEMSRRTIVAAVVIALTVGSALAVALNVRRDQEWAHGGDALTAQAELRMADAVALPDTAVALGYPADEPVALPSSFTQSVVVRVHWRAAAHRSGRYQLIVLDKRVAPPRALPVYGGWKATGGTGSKLGGCILRSRRALRLASRHRPGPGRDRWLDLGWPGGRCARDRLRHPHGGFLVTPTALPITDTAVHLLVSIFYVDESGEVRWARRVAG